jgi:hypothetical protein
MIADTIASLAAMQESDGSFLSEVTGPTGKHADRNGFTTAMIVRALRDLSGDSDLGRLRGRALDYIERCRALTVPGAYGFWPQDARPAWGDRLTADVDDTAIMTIELLRHERLSKQDGLRTVCTILLRNRHVVRPDEFRPPWIVNGAFHTWIGQAAQANVVDCCVNANAVALMAWVGATHLPGYDEAVQTVLAGLEWASDEPARLRSLTPFYPASDSLFEAVEHAVECGALSLTPALDRLRHLSNDTGDPGAGCCSSAYGATIWRCPALELARSLRHTLRGPGNCDRDRRAIGRGVHHVVLRVP